MTKSKRGSRRPRDDGEANDGASGGKRKDVLERIRRAIEAYLDEHNRSPTYLEFEAIHGQSMDEVTLPVVR